MKPDDEHVSCAHETIFVFHERCENLLFLMRPEKKKKCFEPRSRANFYFTQVFKRKINRDLGEEIWKGCTERSRVLLARIDVFQYTG